MLSKTQVAFQVARLHEIIEARKALEAEEKALKDALKKEGITSGTYGEHVVIVRYQTRESFDYKGLKAALSPEQWERIGANEFLKTTEFPVLTIDKAA